MLERKIELIGILRRWRFDYSDCWHYLMTVAVLMCHLRFLIWVNVSPYRSIAVIRQGLMLGMSFSFFLLPLKSWSDRGHWMHLMDLTVWSHRKSYCKRFQQRLSSKLNIWQRRAIIWISEWKKKPMLMACMIFVEDSRWATSRNSSFDRAASATFHHWRIHPSTMGHDFNISQVDYCGIWWNFRHRPLKIDDKGKSSNWSIN